MEAGAPVAPVTGVTTTVPSARTISTVTAQLGSVGVAVAVSVPPVARVRLSKTVWPGVAG